VTRRCGAPEPLQYWGDLGLEFPWSSRGIVRYGRTAASGTYGFFRRSLLCRGDFSPSVNRLVGSAAVVSAVAADRDGIGYSSAGFLNSGVRALAVRDSAGEDMPLSRELLLYVNLPPGHQLPALVATFLATALGVEGQNSVRAAGYATLPATRRAYLFEHFALDDY
jgi:phosphate transport system substrate-binding protein